MPTAVVNGIEIFYRQEGREDAPALLLSNSLGSDHRMWDPQAAVLRRRFQVVRYDTRGHGASAAHPEPYEVTDCARDALALMDHLGHERFHFCGLSMGGMVGMQLALDASQRIDRLVLCNTAARIEPPALWDRRIEAVRAGGMAAVEETVLGRLFSAEFRAANPAPVEAARKALLANPAVGYAAACAAVRDFDFRDRLAAIQAPTLVIAGSLDGATPVEGARFLKDRIPGARLVVLEAAHLSNLEQPEEFTAALLSFLKA